MLSIARTSGVVLRGAGIATIPFGYAITENLFPEFGAQYLILNLASALAMAYIAVRASRMKWRALYVWVVWSLLLTGYFIKYYVLLFMHSSGATLLLARYLPFGQETLFSETSCLTVFRFITWAAIGLALATWVLGATADRHAISPTAVTVTGPFAPALRPGLAVVAVLLSSLSLIVAIAYGYRWGDAKNQPFMPFHIAGWISHIRTNLVPTLFLLAIYQAYTAERRVWARLLTVALWSDALLTSWMTTSKTPLVFVLISVALLWAVLGGLTNRRMLVLLCLMVVTLVATLFLSSFRQMRAWSSNSAVTDSTSAARQAFGGDGESGLAIAVASLIMRVPGADVLLTLLDKVPEVSPNSPTLLLSTNSLDSFYMHDILNFHGDATTGIALSFLGFIALSFGKFGGFALLGTACWCLLWSRFAFAAERHALQFAGIARILLVLECVLLTSEGSIQPDERWLAFLGAYGMIVGLAKLEHVAGGDKRPMQNAPVVYRPL